MRVWVIAAAKALAILAACFGSLSLAVILRKPASVPSPSTLVLIFPSSAPALFGSSPSSRAASLATPRGLDDGRGLGRPRGREGDLVGDADVLRRDLEQGARLVDLRLALGQQVGRGGISTTTASSSHLRRQAWRT